MRSMRVGQVLRVTVLCAAVPLLLSDAGARSGRAVMAAQRSPAMNSGRPIDPPPTGVPAYSPDLGNSTESPADAQLRANASSADRHKKVAADVDKLVALSNELKSEMDKTNKDELSLDVIRKAQEIEKLAHDVQSRMKN
ncbi:MAG TPA: hypothetical protein VMD97_11565 [Candidatus Aquilonibacter sp.]|nr:hypothetical protein [Candidatus Aquilonibacter sp.]